MSDKLSLAERLTDARIGTGLTIPQAARRVGVKTSTLKKWESGASVPRANRLQMLSGVLNVSLIWLLNGRKDLDPLEMSPDAYEVIGQKLANIKNLQSELASAISDLESDILAEQERSQNLDRMAEEAIPS